MEQVGRIDRLELGPFAFESVVARFSAARGGTLAERNMAGIIDGEMLRRFRATLDYPGRRGLPAAEAGIEAGDLVEAFDGISAAKPGPEPLRRVFRSGPGRTHELELRRGDRRYRAELQLRRLV